MEWLRGKRLGHGSFACVDLAVATGGRSSLPRIMAVKSCPASQAESVSRERAILEELKDCPQVIHCFGDCFSCENGDELYNLLLEYAAGGSLAEKLGNRRDRRFPESEVRRYTRGLLQGIRCIHEQGYVHGDIKLQNILLSADCGVKIADFGLAKRRDSGTELRGTPMYMAPEMVRGEGQGTAADIWAVGCAVAEMASGSPPWRCSDSAASLILRIGDAKAVPEIPDSLSEEGRDFLRKCFVKESGARWTAEMLLDHPFVQGIDGEEEEEKAWASTSPRCPLDYSDREWCGRSPSFIPSPVHSSGSGSFSWFSGESGPGSTERIRGLIGEDCGLDWPDSSRWISIR